jgi:hypothetical protein
VCGTRVFSIGSFRHGGKDQFFECSEWISGMKCGMLSRGVRTPARQKKRSQRKPGRILPATERQDVNPGPKEALWCTRSTTGD